MRGDVHDNTHHQKQFSISYLMPLPIKKKWLIGGSEKKVIIRIITACN